MKFQKANIDTPPAFILHRFSNRANSPLPKPLPRGAGSSDSRHLRKAPLLSRPRSRPSNPPRVRAFAAWSASGPDSPPPTPDTAARTDLARELAAATASEDSAKRAIDVVRVEVSRRTVASPKSIRRFRSPVSRSGWKSPSRSRLRRGPLCCPSRPQRCADKSSTVFSAAPSPA